MAKKIVKDLNSRQLNKLKHRLNRAGKTGRIKRHQKDALHKVAVQRRAKEQKKMTELIDDYVHVRSHNEIESNEEFEHLKSNLLDDESNGRVKTEEMVNTEYKREPGSETEDSSDDEALPLDMLDDEMEGYVEAKEEVESDDDEELRRFKTDLAENEEELLPIKLDSGKIVTRVRKIDIDDMKEEEDEETAIIAEEKDKYSNLSAAELMLKRKEVLENTKDTIAHLSLTLTADPEKSASSLKLLLEFAAGKKVHEIVQDAVRKFAIGSLSKVFSDIAPGYPIRSRTEQERMQKMGKQAKSVFQFESMLIANYAKYLQILEKGVKYFTNPKQRQFDEASSNFKHALVCARAVEFLAVKLPHFNYATNIITLVIRLATCNYHPVVVEACQSLSTILNEDIQFKISLHIAKSVATIIGKKSNCINPELLITFLSLKIKEVDNGQAKKERTALEIKKQQLLKEKKCKTEAKFAYQLKQMEHDIKKIQAAESLATKLKYATDTMKQVFLIYFRVIRRMSTTKLLGPVLAGLSKFAHLINIEFFDDLTESLEGLLELQHLSVIDALNCVKTVFIVLSGEGLALNIDPYKFYRCMYRIIPSIPFEKSEKLKDERIEVLVESINLMLNRRKKQVSLVRVAAYVKVLLATCFMLSTRHCAAILASLRSLFLTFSGLLRMVEEDTDVVMNGVYRPEVGDPDICNALASSALPELRRLSKHPDSIIFHFANNILNGCPSSGANRLKADWVTILPKEWVSTELIENSRSSPFLDQLKKAAQKRKAGPLSSKNLCSTVEFWLRD